MAEGDIGKILWQDLTVADADGVRDFYEAVVGWKINPVKMGDYHDYCMQADGKDVAGVCHARGQNAKIPPQWLIYVKVASVAESVAAAKARGGTVLDGPRPMVGSAFAVTRDPAGAVMAIME